MAAPNQPVSTIYQQTHRRGGVGRLLKGHRIFITPPDFGTEARFISVLEPPKANPTLLACPELCVGASNVPQELSDLSLPERVGPELQERWAAGVDGSAHRDLENTGAATSASELGQSVALAGIIGATIQGEVLVEPLGVRGDDIFFSRGSVVRKRGGVREELIIGRVVIVVIMVEGLGDVIQAVVADLVVTLLGGGGAELLTIGVDVALGSWGRAEAGEGISVVIVVLDGMFIHY